MLYRAKSDVSPTSAAHFSHMHSSWEDSVKCQGFLLALHGLDFLCVQSRGPTEGYPNSSVVLAEFFDVYLRSVHVTVFEVSPDTAYVFVAATALQITAGGLV